MRRSFLAGVGDQIEPKLIKNPAVAKMYSQGGKAFGRGGNLRSSMDGRPAGNPRGHRRVAAEYAQAATCTAVNMISAAVLLLGMLLPAPCQGAAVTVPGKHGNTGVTLPAGLVVGSKYFGIYVCGSVLVNVEIHINILQVAHGIQ